MAMIGDWVGADPAGDPRRTRTAMPPATEVAGAERLVRPPRRSVARPSGR